MCAVLSLLAPRSSTQRRCVGSRRSGARTGWMRVREQGNDGVALERPRWLTSSASAPAARAALILRPLRYDPACFSGDRDGAGNGGCVGYAVAESERRLSARRLAIESSRRRLHLPASSPSSLCCAHPVAPVCTAPPHLRAVDSSSAAHPQSGAAADSHTHRPPPRSRHSPFLSSPIAPRCPPAQL